MPGLWTTLLLQLVNQLKRFMNETEPKFIEAIPYEIIACDTIQKLEKKVSARIKEGRRYLYGRPFDLRNQICQALTLLRMGQ